MIVVGVTRIVVLVGGYAFKLPCFWSWRRFLLGLLANMTEHAWSRVHDKRLCPVLFSVLGGFLNVMPRCEPLQRDDRLGDGYSAYYTRYYDDLPVENKADSFGYYQKRIVAIDYGIFSAKGTVK